MSEMISVSISSLRACAVAADNLEGDVSGEREKVSGEIIIIDPFELPVSQLILSLLQSPLNLLTIVLFLMRLSNARNRGNGAAVKRNDRTRRRHPRVEEGAHPRAAEGARLGKNPAVMTSILHHHGGSIMSLLVIHVTAG
jgi:hypothetical protein